MKRDWGKVSQILDMLVWEIKYRGGCVCGTTRAMPCYTTDIALHEPRHTILTSVSARERRSNQCKPRRKIKNTVVVEINNVSGIVDTQSALQCGQSAVGIGATRIVRKQEMEETAEVTSR